MGVMTEIWSLIYYTQFKYHHTQFSDGYDEKKLNETQLKSLHFVKIGYDEIILTLISHSGCVLITLTFS